LSGSRKHEIFRRFGWAFGFSRIARADTEAIDANGALRSQSFRTLHEPWEPVGL